MSSEEKKLKKYLRAVSRRLNLPSDVKKRVMSDFSGDLQARREAGMTVEEILAELGSPGKAAADLNEQMKEYAYRKSPWRYLFAACAVYGAVKLLAGVWLNILYWILQVYMNIRTMLFPGEVYSIGIIGGADGPTAVFVTTPDWISNLFPVLLVVGGVWGYLRLRKCKQK